MDGWGAGRSPQGAGGQREGGASRGGARVLGAWFGQMGRDYIIGVWPGCWGGIWVGVPFANRRGLVGWGGAWGGWGEEVAWAWSALAGRGLDGGVGGACPAGRGLPGCVT